MSTFMAIVEGERLPEVRASWRREPYNDPAQTCLNCGGFIEPIPSSPRKDHCTRCMTIHVFVAVSSKAMAEAAVEGIPTRQVNNHRHPSGTLICYRLISTNRRFDPLKRRRKTKGDRAW